MASSEVKSATLLSRMWGVLAIVILIGSYTASAVWVVRHSMQDLSEEQSDKVVIRLAHSIADRRIQAAFDQMADEYEALHPGVRVDIQAIPRRAYQQWVTTQCLGKTVPDIVQAESKWDLWSSLAARYMVPLSSRVNQPNPYNQGGELEGVPWRSTYVDSMQGGYWQHLTEYFSVPITTETVRIFYNKDLFVEATGSDAPPEDLAGWFEICDRLNVLGETRGLKLSPIAGSREVMYRVVMDRYYRAICNGMGDPFDACYWGSNRPEQALYGRYTGTWTFDHPRVHDAFEVVKQIAGYCQPGFAGSDNSQARFLFMQGKGAMIMGSARDAAIYMAMADFEVGVFDFPMPSPEHPVLGKYGARPPAETGGNAIHFCVSRQSKNTEQALDFLMFMSSQSINERFNKAVAWYPAIRGAESRPELRTFKPNIGGVSGRVMPLTVAPGVDLWFQQQLPRYLDGQMSFEDLSAGLDRLWLEKGADDFVRRDQIYAGILTQAEYNIANSKSRMLFAEAGELKPGALIGDRTAYQLAIEANELLRFGIASRAYTWHQLQKGNYPYP